MRLIPYAQLVYFPVNTGAGNETPFPMVDELADDDVRVVGVITFDRSTLVALPDNSGVVTPGDASNITVTINQGNDQRLLDVPYRDLGLDQNGGVWYEWEPFRIDLTKCSVKTCLNFPQGPGSAAFVFIYIKLSDYAGAD